MATTEELAVIKMICLSQLMTEQLDELKYTNYSDRLDKSTVKKLTNQLLLVNSRSQSVLTNNDETMFQRYTEALDWAVENIAQHSIEELVHEYDLHINNK